ARSTSGDIWLAWTSRREHNARKKATQRTFRPRIISCSSGVARAVGRGKSRSSVDHDQNSVPAVVAGDQACRTPGARGFALAWWAAAVTTIFTWRPARR